MIYTLTVTAVWGHYLEEECARILEIAEKASLEQLHLAIQDAVSFGNDHPYAFYDGRNYRHRKIRCADEDVAANWYSLERVWGMTKLSVVYPLHGLKLYYHFDFGDNWIFEIRKARKVKPVEAGVSYPRLIESRGPVRVYLRGRRSGGPPLQCSKSIIRKHGTNEMTS